MDKLEKEIDVVIPHPYGDLLVPLEVWVSEGPGVRPLLSPKEVYDRSTGERLPKSTIPFRYRNSFFSRLFIKLRLIKSPWGKSTSYDKYKIINTHTKCDICNRSLAEIQALDFVGFDSIVIGQCEKCGLKICLECKSPDMPFGSTHDFKKFIYLKNGIHILEKSMCPKCGIIYQKTDFVASPDGTVLIK